MTTSYGSLLQLYREILSASWMRGTAKELGLRRSGGVFTWSVVIWLMIGQRLQGRGTLAEAVGAAIRGSWGPLVPAVQRGQLSSRTGGYCRARQRMPISLLTAAVRELTAGLQQKLASQEESPARPVYLLDGSSLQLPHERDLWEAYPPAKNQQGESHWPVVKIAVLHNARSGLAVAPAWGPMYGKGAVSEQDLAERLLAALAPGSVVVGDRNFGIFAMAWSAAQRGHAVIFRLTAVRARSLANAPLVPGQQQSLIWKPTAWDRRKHPQLPPQACVKGRLLVYSLAGFREPLYLFTTLEESAEEIFRTYGLRWNIETDWRSLKQTVRLHRVAVKSPGMLEKELWAAVAAYNLVRTVMSLAAREAGGSPRELSFTQVLNLTEAFLQAFLPSLLATPASAKTQRELHRLIQAARQCRLPRRPKPRSYPRAVWSAGYRYPQRHEGSEQNGK